MKNKFIFLLLLFIFSVSSGYSQNIPLHFIVKDNNEETLPGAHVVVKNSEKRGELHAVTDVKGKASFSIAATGKYKVKVSFIGYTIYEKEFEVTASKNHFVIKLEPSAVELNTVTVNAAKPLIRQEEDKTIIDPEPIANTSTNTLEILESSPGVYVDQEGGIFIAGMRPAVVYINGREQKLSSEDIASILRSLPPSSIEKIEIIKTPSTKYDASASGGIVNIVLKKGVKFGRFGSTTAGFSQGKYSSGNLGFTYNNSGDILSGYINANYNYNDYYEEMNTQRILKLDTILLQCSGSRSSNHQFYLGYGFSHETPSRINFNYDGRISANFKEVHSDNDNNINTTEEVLLSSSNNKIDNNSDFTNIQQDFGMLIKLDSTESVWDNKISYTYGFSPSELHYNTSYSFPVEFNFSGKGNNRNDRHFFIFQSDILYKLPIKLKLEVGFKSSFQLLNSKTEYLKNFNGQEIEDLDRTSSFSYTDAIQSAYVQATKELLWGLVLKTGLRSEYASMDGKQTIPQLTSFKTKNLDFFPYVYLSRRLIKMMGIELFGNIIYRKTINRPGYSDLNPYIRMIDEFIYETGNPSLKPQYTDNVEVNISFNDMPVFAMGRNETRDIFSMVTYKDTAAGKNMLMRTYDNLGTSRESYLRGIVGIPPGGVYFFALGGQYNYNEFDGFYQGEPFQFKRGSWRFFTFHSLKLFKNTRLTFNGFLMTKGQWNFYELENFGQLNAGLTQTFFNKKLTINISARDILRTMKTRFSFDQGGIISTGDRYSDNQKMNINIRYNFGLKSKKEEKKEFLKSGEEEM